MIGNRVLLDTNIVSALLKGETLIADQIEKLSDIFIPVTVLGELYYGAAYSTNIERNTQNLIELSQAYVILPAIDETAKIYGVIKASLRKKGTPIPENDIWIAAIAKHYDLKLVTRDKHFNHTGLDIAVW